MVNIKSFIREFIQAEELQPGDKAKIRTEPYFDEEAKFKSLIAEVDYNGEHRKLNINKGNAKRISAVYGEDTKAWIQKEIYIRLPETDDEKKSRSELIIVAAQPPQDTDEKIAKLRARGVTDEQIARMKEAGVL